MSGDPYIKENEWLEAEIARLEAGREKLLETNQWQAGEIERLRAALEWYASRDRTREQYIWDDGTRARKALAKEGK